MKDANGLIRKTRLALGESQAAFAKRFRVDQSTVHRWETEGPPERGAAAFAIERVLAELTRGKREEAG